MNGKSTAAVVVLEPSKLGPQHITLIEAYLVALRSLDLPARGVGLVYAAHPTSFAALSGDLRAGLVHRPVDVIDADARRWVAKALLEVRVVASAIRRLGPRDVLIVTCVTAPALLILETLSRLIGRRRVVVVLHSELEALFDPTLRSPRSWGFWSHRWSRLRRRGSRLGVAVIAGFVRDALAGSGIAALAPDQVEVLTFPVGPTAVPAVTALTAVPAATPTAVPANGLPRVAFIGYKTRMKGFEIFVEAARRLATAGLVFDVVGAGGIETIPAGTRRPYGPGEFIGEVGASAVAFFPYEQGYDASMSAAALDALSTGVHLLATRRGCFKAIERELGPETITLVDTVDEAVERLADPAFIARAAAGKAERRERLAEFGFGMPATLRDFARLLDGFGLHAARAGA